MIFCGFRLSVKRLVRGFGAAKQSLKEQKKEERPILGRIGRGLDQLRLDL